MVYFSYTDIFILNRSLNKQRTLSTMVLSTIEWRCLLLISESVFFTGFVRTYFDKTLGLSPALL